MCWFWPFEMWPYLGPTNKMNLMGRDGTEKFSWLVTRVPMAIWVQLQLILLRLQTNWSQRCQNGITDRIHCVPRVQFFTCSIYLLISPTRTRTLPHKMEMCKQYKQTTISVVRIPYCTRRPQSPSQHRHPSRLWSRPFPRKYPTTIPIGR